MESFCKYCGTPINQGVTHCPSCGGAVEQPQSAPVQSPVQPQQNTYQPQYTQPQPAYTYPQPETTPPPKKKKKTGLIIGIIVGAVALAFFGIIALILFIGMFSIEDYQKPVEAWVESVEENDVDKMYDSYYDFWIDMDYSEEYVKDDFQNGIDYLDEVFEDEAGYGYKLSIEYGDCTPYSEDELDEALDNLKDADIYIDIEEAYDVEVTIVAKGENGSYEYDEMTFVVALVDDEWKIIAIRGLPDQY